MTTVGGTVNKMIDINENINFLKSDSSYWQLNKSITKHKDRRVLYIIILITIHLLGTQTLQISYIWSTDRNSSFRLFFALVHVFPLSTSMIISTWMYTNHPISFVYILEKWRAFIIVKIICLHAQFMYCKRPYEEISSVDKYLNTKTEQLRKIQGIKNSPLVPWWFRTVFKYPYNYLRLL